VDRREFLQSMGKVTAALLAAMSAESVDIVRHLEASDLGRGTLAQLDGTIERLGREYVYRPLPELMAEVRAWRLYVVRLLEGRHTLAQRRDLYALQGWLSSLLGSLAFDLGEESSVGAHYATALQLAGEAGHDGLAAWIYGEQAYNAIYAGQPERAVALARAGQELAPAGSVSAVRLLAWEAWGLARTGDAAGFEGAMGRAAQAFGRLTEPPGRTLFSFDPASFPFYGASSYVWLSQPRRAVEQAQRAIELLDAAPADWPGRRVNARLDLAGALVQLGEVEDACAAGSEALGIHASSRQDFNSVRRAIELRSALQPHRALPVVRELDERFDAVCGDPGTRFS